VKSHQKKIAVVLAGCGNKDGSEIIESVSTLIAITGAGASYQCFAPSLNYNPKNFITNKSIEGEVRNTLTEAARIARSEISDLKELNPDLFDGIVLPGGYGAATLLSTWGSLGAKSEVYADLAKLLRQFHEQSKPIGAICIAPVILAKLFGKEGVEVTIGSDTETAAEIKKTGAVHIDCPVTDFVTDRDHKVITTPAFMLEATPNEVFLGISRMINELVEMA
jgi:enhancing lycopene biosynthesis protein 2